MLFYQAAFGICVLLLCSSYAALMAAHKRGDKRQVRVLHFFRLGLSLSAMSYFLRIMDAPRAGHASFLVFVTCLAGTAFIWKGWVEHWRMRRGRLNAPAGPREEEEGIVPELALTPGPVDGLSRLSPRARQVLHYAQDEARRRQGAVDTDHLLLGLLREPHSAGVLILTTLGVNLEKIHSELALQSGSGQTALRKSWKSSLDRPQTAPPVFTDRARSVIALAAQEAHRFDRTSIGTEHLLLGLLLVGRGTATYVLFQEGATVEQIRSEIMKQGNAEKVNARR